MSQRWQGVSAIRSLVAGVQSLQRNRVHRPQVPRSIDEPENPMGISIGRNNGVASAANLDGLRGRRIYERTIAKRVGEYRAGLTGEIYGVVPINRRTALSASALGYFLHNLRVPGSAIRT